MPFARAVTRRLAGRAQREHARANDQRNRRERDDRSDGTHLTDAKWDRFVDDDIDLYFMNDAGVYDEQIGARYYYATARACFATKELFVTPNTKWMTWNVGDSHYTFNFEPGAVSTQ